MTVVKDGDMVIRKGSPPPGKGSFVGRRVMAVEHDPIGDGRDRLRLEFGDGGCQVVYADEYELVPQGVVMTAKAESRVALVEAALRNLRANGCSLCTTAEVYTALRKLKATQDKWPWERGPSNEALHAIGRKHFASQYNQGMWSIGRVREGDTPKTAIQAAREAMDALTEDERVDVILHYS